MLPISMTCMSLNPERARFFNISHPKPPAPLHISQQEERVRIHSSKTYITLPSHVSRYVLKYRHCPLQYLHTFMTRYSLNTSRNSTIVARVILLGFVGERSRVFTNIVQVLPKCWSDRKHKAGSSQQTIVNLPWTWRW